jgi:uncharacterized membrane protein YfcA
VGSTVLVAALFGVLVAGMMQRITGIGFALVASPVLIVAVGADEAVRLVIVTSLVSSGYSLFATRRECRLRQVLPLLPFAVLVIWPAGLVARAIDPAASSLAAGVVVLLALAVAFHPKGVPGGSTWVQAGVAGSLSGAMNAVAALGGPMAAAYGIGRKWGSSLVPNMQLFLLITSLVVLAVRGWPATTSSAQLWVLMLAAAAGVGLGGHLAGHVSPSRAGLFTASIAALGALVAIGRGFSGMV